MSMPSAATRDALACLLAFAAHAETPRLGQPISAAELASCHGPKGIVGSGGHLISDGATTGPDQDPAINDYWPYATTLWDFTRRAMPMDAPGSLTADETYAVTAWLLHLSGLLDEKTLPAIRMPNCDGLDWIDARRP